jgi:hypothetical protein
MRLGLGSAAAFGRSGLIDQRARWPGGLGGQEQNCQEDPGRGYGASDDAADGQAAQERVGGRMLESQAEGRVAAGRDLACGHVGRPDGLVRDRRDRTWHTGRHNGGEP